MIEFLVFIFFIFIVIAVPIVVLISVIWVAKYGYDTAKDISDKVYALCFPLTMAMPFLYYNFINDSLWQAALSFCIIPIVIGVIWDEENGIFGNNSKNKAEKIYALCTPFFYVVPFIYYNYINDSLWQAALSFFITPIVIIFAIGLIWGEENDIFDDETTKVASSMKMYNLPPLCSISSFVLAFMYYFAFRDSLAEAVLLFCVVQLIMIGIWGKRLVKK